VVAHDKTQFGYRFAGIADLLDALTCGASFLPKKIGEGRVAESGPMEKW